MEFTSGREKKLSAAKINQFLEKKLLKDDRLPDEICVSISASEERI